MPTGHTIPNMMDNEVVEFFYTCIQNVDGSINFGEVAKTLGLKDTKAARERMRVIIRAQEKTGSGPSHSQGRKAKGVREGVTGRPAKKQKRKVSKIEEDGEEARGESIEAAEQEDGEALEHGENGSGIETIENDF